MPGGESGPGGRTEAAVRHDGAFAGRNPLSLQPGAIQFCRGFLKYRDARYQESFYLLGCAAEQFSAANQAMRDAEYGVWNGFYENDCLTDIKFTAYVIRSMMRVVRGVGDDPVRGLVRGLGPAQGRPEGPAAGNHGQPYDGRGVCFWR